MNPDDLSARLLELAVRIGRVVDALPETRLGRHIAEPQIGNLHCSICNLQFLYDRGYPETKLGKKLALRSVGVRNCTGDCKLQNVHCKL